MFFRVCLCHLMVKYIILILVIFIYLFFIFFDTKTKTKADQVQGVPELCDRQSLGQVNGKCS